MNLALLKYVIAYFFPFIFKTLKHAILGPYLIYYYKYNNEILYI